MINKPWLYLPASFSHSFGPWGLRQMTKLRPLSELKADSFNKQGIYFRNPFGTAGGLDKEGKDLFTWQKLGAGFLEVGTLTPEPQEPNPGKILDRSNEHQALWNSMGFPNAGFKAVKPRIIKYKNKVKDTPLFINIGKNRNTPLEEAYKDYVKGINMFSEEADAFVVNISSPNTKDLRKLHERENFKKFISPIVEENKRQAIEKPILIKISPDLPDESLESFASLCLEYPLGGWVLTNTTTERFDQTTFPKHGGVSGLPLADLSRKRLSVVSKVAKSAPDRLVVSVGGVMSPKEALHRLDLGADLVEFYSGLIFFGPRLFKECIKKLNKKVKT